MSHAESEIQTTGWTVALAICFVLEMLIWWKLNFSPWVLLYGFVCACRGRFAVRRETAKDSANDQAERRRERGVATD